jgi:DNA-directed RNA polymerase specialized sigma24 family protein
VSQQLNGTGPAAADPPRRPKAFPHIRDGRHAPLRELSHADEARLRAGLASWAVRALGLPRHEFADTYQAAWRKLLEGEGRGRPVRDLQYALRWAMHNCWLEECRLRRRRPTVALDECPPSAIGGRTGPDPAEQLERLETARYLFEVARTLGELSWRTVLLRDIWGLPAAEVRRTLGIGLHRYEREHARGLHVIHARLARQLAGRECAGRTSSLRAVAAGTATSSERRATERHTRNCAGCRRTLAALTRRARARAARTAQRRMGRHPTSRSPSTSASGVPPLPPGPSGMLASRPRG